MRSQQITTSAALYFGPEPSRLIPLLWMERARELFAEYNLSPILFTASGGDFLFDDCYVLAERGDDLVKWGELLPARGGDLVDSLRSGEIESLTLDSPRGGSVSRSDWRATVSVSSTPGECYVGLDESLISNASFLVCRAYRMAKGLFDIRYGIAYKMQLAQHPDCYASGFEPGTVAEAFEMIRHRDQWEHRTKSPIELWRDELNGQGRHLTGLFRGAYPANILSESHVRKADLRSHGIGRLSELDESLWLWELSEAEIPEAERILEAQGVLVRQAGQP